MNHLRTGVLMLGLAGEGDRDRRPLRRFALKDARGILHIQSGADVTIDPFHLTIIADDGPLGHKIDDVVRPILDG